MSPRDHSPSGRQAGEAERRLLLRYHHEHDLAAREELVKRFLPLARELAHRYAYSGEPLDDLVQVATVGLIKAIDRFDPGRGTKLSSYAVPTIVGELKRHFRDVGWWLHVPRDVQERALLVGRARETLAKRLGRSPAARDIATELDCSVGEILEADEASASYSPGSLDTPVAGGEGGTSSLGDLVGAEEPAYELVENSDAVAEAWRSLSGVERTVFELRLTGNLTQREIGERVGYSQMHVSRLLRRAVTRLETAAAHA